MVGQAAGGRPDQLQGPSVYLTGASKMSYECYPTLPNNLVRNATSAYPDTKTLMTYGWKTLRSCRT
eukprot:4515069-Prorocentrum_lima.AAC.1